MLCDSTLSPVHMAVGIEAAAVTAMYVSSSRAVTSPSRRSIT
jgi:hypothetical protein